MYVPYDVRQMQDQEVTVVTECVYQQVRGYAAFNFWRNRQKQTIKY